MGKISRKARAYILFIILSGTILVGIEFSNYSLTQAPMLAVLSALATISMLYKVIGATERSHYSFNFIVYAFALVALDVEGAIIVIVISFLIEWIKGKYPWYIQAFNIFSYIIAIELAGTAFTAFHPVGQMSNLLAALAALTAIFIFTITNHLMIGIVLFLARGENFANSGMFEWFPLMLDFSLMSMGAGLAFLWKFNPLATVLGLIPIYLIYSTLKVPQLERKTNLDGKTGLFNAEYYKAELENELNRANRFEHSLTVVLCDLDLLRNINNTYGHLAGDVVLKGIADILRLGVRSYDLVARFGGEEFAILMPETIQEEAVEVCERLRAQVQATEFVVSTSVTPIHATLSFGIAGRTLGSSMNGTEITHNADVALYHAKLSGRNRVVLFTEMGENPFQIPTQEKETPAPVSKPEPAPKPAAAPAAVSTPPEPGDAAAPRAAQATPSADKKSNPAPVQAKISVNGFITMLFLIACLLFALAFKPGEFDWLTFFYFGVIVGLSEWLSVEIYVRDTSISTSIVPMLAGALLLGPVGAVGFAAVFALVTMLKHRSPINRFFFNFSNQAIAFLALLLLLRWVGVDFPTISLLFQVVIGAAAGGLVFLVTTFLLAMIIQLNLGTSFLSIWKERFQWLSFSYFVLGLVAVVLSFGFTQIGLLGILAVLLPLYLMRVSQKQYIQRTEQMVSELRAKNAALEASSKEINDLNSELFDALVEAIDLRDPYVIGHSRHVARYARLIGVQLGLPADQLDLLYKAGLLHDIGKLGISEAILFKPSRLTRDEYEEIKKHAALSAEILKTSHILQGYIPIIIHHHEQVDGKGYPFGISGDAIPLEARIIALADAVEAMASDRPYRKALPMPEIVAELERYSGTQFDAQVVRAFQEVIRQQGEVVIVNSAKEVFPRASLSVAF